MEDHAFSARVRREFQIPASCPFTISKISVDHRHQPSTWLIRERDQYGEYPHIYAKLCVDDSQKHEVIVLSDTGCGTEISNSNHSKRFSGPSQPKVWNIRTFLEYTINPKGRIGYLVMTTHCHFDHIMGIGKLPPTLTTNGDDCQDKQLPRPPTQVLSSAKGQSFVTPYSNLQKHSLCSVIDLQAPHYAVNTWAHDYMKVAYVHHKGTTIPTNITIIHTQGHTPDSLSWYDSDLHLLCVGDSFYTKESQETRHAPWGSEPPMPTIFDLKSDLAAWWGQMGKIAGFVREENRRLDTDFGGEDRRQDGPERGEGEGEEIVIVDKHGNEQTIDYDVWLDPAHDQHLRDMAGIQDGFNGNFSHRQYEVDAPGPAPSAEPWLFIDHETPRVKLCAAHTNLSMDAQTAIREMKDFVAAILRGEVPSKRAEHGPRGEERWLWDYSLEDKRGSYSVLAPLSIIEDGRAKIPRSQWALRQDLPMAGYRTWD